MRRVVVWVAAAVLVSGVVACGTEGTPEASALDVSLVDYGFEGFDTTITGGAVTLNVTNDGQASHEIALIDIGDASFDEFKAGFPPVLEGGPFPDFFDEGMVPVDLDPGDSMTTTVTLPEGEYLLFCAFDDAPGGEGEHQPTGEPHYELGMYQEITVEEGAGELEATDGEFVASDWAFDVPADITAGTGTYRFRNEGPTNWHHVIVQAYPEGTTEEEATAAFGQMLQLPEGQPPPAGLVMPEEAGATGIFSPGLGQTIELTFEEGRTYVAVCFIQDLAGGPPHAVGHNMIRAFTV